MQFTHLLNVEPWTINKMSADSKLILSMELTTSLWMDSDELDQYGTNDDMDFVIYEEAKHMTCVGKFSLHI